MSTGWRPQLGKSVPKPLVHSLGMCWHQDPAQRWSAARLVKELQQVVGTLAEPQPLWKRIWRAMFPFAHKRTTVAVLDATN
jgi:hypothetical protein